MAMVGNEAKSGATKENWIVLIRYDDEVKNRVRFDIVKVKLYRWKKPVQMMVAVFPLLPLFSLGM